MERRRFIQIVGTVPIVGLAGCSTNDGQPETDGDDVSQGQDAEADGTGDEESPPPEEDIPTLDEFEYPDGATQDGIDTGQLYSTHEATLTDAGSLTVTREQEHNHGGHEFSIAETNRFESNNISQEVVDGGDSEFIWAPANEDVAYVQMESGFEQGYRINNQPPRTNRVTGLGEIDRILSETEWSEAKTVIELEDGDGFAVTYDAIDHSEQIGFGEIEEFEATVAVTESAYISGLEYNIIESEEGRTAERDMTTAVSAVGETTVEEPDWATMARDQGTRFSVSATDDQGVYELELIHGNEIPAGARISMRDRQGGEGRQLQQPLAVGDRLYVGLSETNDLLTSTEQVPDGVRQLHGSTNLRIRSEFLLFEEEL